MDKSTVVFFIFNQNSLFSPQTRCKNHSEVWLIIPFTFTHPTVQTMYMLEWAIICPEERSWAMGQHGYTPLVEVNQAVIAWSYRQTLFGHTELPIKTKFLSQMISSDLKRSGLLSWKSGHLTHPIHWHYNQIPLHTREAVEPAETWQVL